jgi:phi LC3 family holin
MEVEKMNLKVRFKNPVFIAQLILAILTPILAYAGLTVQDLTSWQALGEILLGAIRNPYVLGLIVVSVWNALNDPTTAGITDSAQALTYDKPKAKE